MDSNSYYEESCELHDQNEILNDDISELRSDLLFVHSKFAEAKKKLDRVMALLARANVYVTVTEQVYRRDGYTKEADMVRELKKAVIQELDGPDL